MEITPTRLLVLCTVLFGGIVALGVVSQAQSNEQLKLTLGGLDLTSLRQRLNREEGIPEQSESEPEEAETPED